MNNHQKVLAFGSILAIILFSLLFWQQMPHEDGHNVKSKEIQAIEKGVYATMDDAERALRSELSKDQDVNTVIYSPSKNLKLPFYTMQFSYKKDKHKFAGYAFAVPVGNHYKLEIADAKIKTYQGMKPVRISMKVGEDKVHMFIGTPADNPFSDSVRHSFDNEVELAHHVE